jgi:putative Ig domain-containing protein
MLLRKLAFRGVGFCVAGLLSGCGGSSPAPPSSPLSITTSSLQQGVINVPYNTSLSATGGVTPYGWNIASGNLPPGLSLSRAGVVSGTPAGTGAFTFSVAVADSQQPPSVANGNFGISINAALQITTTSLTQGLLDASYSATLAATGGIAPYTWSITQGALPNGLTLNATSGVISGTPTAAGTSNFTAQVSDAETPAATATAALSIVINRPPPRNAALYTSDSGDRSANQLGLQILSDGSLMQLPSSPETAITGGAFAASPTLPFLFEVTSAYLQSLLVNADYSLTVISSAPLPGVISNFNYAPPSVDPTGSNLYLPGAIDSSGATGVTIYPIGSGSLQASGNVAIPNLISQSRMVFTPDGSLAFIATCPPSDVSNILSFARSSNGTLTLLATLPLAASECVAAMAVSSDGKYLATSEVQVYSIASSGTLTAVLSQQFVFSLNGKVLTVNDLTWDSSGSYLIAGTIGLAELIPATYIGGVGVLQFSGSALTETVPPGSNGPVIRLQQAGHFVYAMEECRGIPESCLGIPQAILGYDFQNGQLTLLPGSPYLYSNQGDMVVY